MADNELTKGTEQTEARQTTGGGSGAGAQGGATGAVQTDGEATMPVEGELSASSPRCGGPPSPRSWPQPT